MKFSETKVLSPIEFKIAKYISIAIIVFTVIATIAGALNGADRLYEPLLGGLLACISVFAILAFFALGARFAETKGRDRETYLILSILTSPWFAAFVAYLWTKRDERIAKNSNTKFDPTTQLLNLSELLKNGMITEEEFNAKKSAILDKM
jgi:Na+-driven multidrug efflux pump